MRLVVPLTERAGWKPALLLSTKKKSPAGGEAQCYTKELYRNSNGFVKQKVWNCPTLARGKFARMGPKTSKACPTRQVYSELGADAVI